MSEKRPNQREFREGVIANHRREFGAVFCRACPVNECGFSDKGEEIPLEAHHCSEAYSDRHSQDPEVGLLICKDLHRKEIHNLEGGLTALGRFLTRLFIEDRKKKRYKLNTDCPYKK